MQTELMQTLRWMRMVGDTVFAIGAVAWVWFAINLMITKGDPQPASEELPSGTIPEAG